MLGLIIFQHHSYMEQSRIEPHSTFVHVHLTFLGLIIGHKSKNVYLATGWRMVAGGCWQSQGETGCKDTYMVMC